jgi:hypothetical protein
MLSGPPIAFGNADGALPGVARLTLELPDGCLGGVGDIVEVELWMRDLPQEVSGFQAFVEYDITVLDYEGDLSEYTLSPFSLHIQPLSTAEVSPGQINLDGSVGFFDPGTTEPALLATLRFSVVEECAVTSVDFRPGPPDTILAFEGLEVPTDPIDSRDFVMDGTPPDIECPDDMSVERPSDLPSPDTGSVTASDNCGGVTVTWVGDVDSGEDCPYDPRFIIRTYRAEDDCGNASNCTQTFTVELGDVGIEEYLEFEACFLGPDVMAPGGCDCWDTDGDGDVDLEDAQQFQILFNGA